MIGFRTNEVEITESSVSDLTVELSEAAIVGDEVIVSASRVEQNILESPVSIEKIDAIGIQAIGFSQPIFKPLQTPEPRELRSEAHAQARVADNNSQAQPGSQQFQSLANELRSTPISEGGALLIEKTGLWHAETKYNFADIIDPSTWSLS